MINRKTTFVTADGKYQMIYTPQRETKTGKTWLASFNLQKWCTTRGDLGDAFVTVNQYATNYKPSRAFPLDEKIESVMQMLVTDYNAAEWFAKLGTK